MNSLQILRVLKGDDLARRYAVGVYPADRLPPVQKYPSALVVNSDPDGMRGSHWLAMYFDDHKKAEFFYSYGLPPEIYGDHFIQFLEKNSSHFVRKEVYSLSIQQFASNTAYFIYCTGAEIFP